MNKKFACWAVVAFALGVARAAHPAEVSLGDVAKHQDLLDVGTDLRLMCVAAHPDDEDGATLAMYRKKYGYKTFDVLATRGEGGQNEIGPELYEKLAVLRTDEMSRAAAITGAELHFLNMPEFGYSKSKEETFQIWGYDKVFERMVRKIREIRPDVIITHHPPQGQHGHHQAIGQIIQDAFDKAGDPSVCPEQIKEGLKPWQPARLYVRNFGGSGDAKRINFNELDPVRGLTYAEIAANALREHKTQGMGFFIDRFLTTRSTASYSLAKEFKGGTQGGGTVPPPGGELFDGLMDRVTPEDRAISQAGLAGMTTAKAIAHLKAARSSDIDAARANKLAAAVAELRITAKLDDSEVVPGQQLKISVEAIDFGAKEAGDVTLELRPKGWFKADAPAPLKTKFAEGFASTDFTVTIPDIAPTIPYDRHVFDDHYLEAEFTATATAEIDGTPVTVEAPVRFDVAPSVSLEFLNQPYLLRPGAAESADYTLLVTNHNNGPIEANVSAGVDKGLSTAMKPVALSFTGEGEQKAIPVHVQADKGLKAGVYALTAKAAAGKSTTEIQDSVNVVDVAVPKDRRVGVVESYDDTFMTTLDRLGVPHEAITANDFTPERLDRFTTIIVDIRTYLVRPDLIGNNQALLDYCKRGGTVIVMYHKTIEWKSSYAPYDLVVGSQRVTVETAPVTLLVPDHPLFNVPNKIAPGDWDNWVQERGLYFPSKWAPEYTPLVSMSDPGEQALTGSVLVAKVGQGTYMYTSLVWYRQLRAMNPGAIRIFANMLAL